MGAGSRYLLRFADSYAFGNPHQFGEGPGLHFFHHSRPMDFDGFFHGAELEGDQFVWHAARDQSHDFAFTRSQFFHAPLNVFNFFPFGTIAVSASDCLFDSAQKICGLNRLGQEIHGAGFHRFYGHRNIAVAGEEHTGGVGNKRISSYRLPI